MTGQQVELATLALPDCVVVPVENAHEITPQDFQRRRFLSAFVNITAKQPIPLPAAPMNLRIARPDAIGHCGDFKTRENGIIRIRMF
jgi:hypothetical protein